MYNTINAVFVGAVPPKVLVPIVIIVGIPALIIILVLLKFFSLWLRAKLSRAAVTFLELIGMRLRRVNPSLIVDSKIMAVQAGLSLTTRDSPTWCGRSLPPTARTLS
jgi:uncharacterized protein YqfA (UPF0365 family)